MNYWSLILIFLVFSSTGVASVPPRYHVRPDDVEAWLQQAIRQSPEETLSALSELQRWKNSSAFTRWQNHSLSPVEIYLPTNSTTDTCYIIRLKEDTPQVFIKFIQETALKLHGEIRSYYEKLFKGLVVCFKNASEDAIESMKELPWIQYIERDCIIWSGQVQKRAPWGLSRISQPRKPLNYQFGFDQTGNGVDVYVLDSGIFSDHPGKTLKSHYIFNFFCC